MSTKHTLAVVSVVNQEQGKHSMKSGGLGKDFPVTVLGEVGSCLEETEAQEATAFSLHVRPCSPEQERLQGLGAEAWYRIDVSLAGLALGGGCVLRILPSRDCGEGAVPALPVPTWL